MALADLTDSEAVRAALAEFDRLGRQAFLARHGFAPARRFFVVADGRHYDSKAIVGAAYGFQFPGRGPLLAAAFSGGEVTVRRRLERLGFVVKEAEEDGGEAGQAGAPP